ncbi:hypothetical protein [Kamptonema sp. UHCC 0994]|nr:hypothetical protein [Kamptonema sp. UHCC 0994]MDF0554823.1 hypothetical protein [Kamptonema sp. UHCC 0994]
MTLRFDSCHGRGYFASHCTRASRELLPADDWWVGFAELRSPI